MGLLVTLVFIKQDNALFYLMELYLTAHVSNRLDFFLFILHPLGVRILYAFKVVIYACASTPKRYGFCTPKKNENPY